ncbi:MAG: hypothetical protein KKB02_07305 [Alphaproteobacteria bacterium]|nr:hypothetical protein [Alphaproteobacteria bacterium]
MTVEHIARRRGTLRLTDDMSDIRQQRSRRKLSEMTVVPLIGVAFGMALAIAALTVAQVTVSVIAATVDPQVSAW